MRDELEIPEKPIFPKCGFVKKSTVGRSFQYQWFSSGSGCIMMLVEIYLFAILVFKH